MLYFLLKSMTWPEGPQWCVSLFQEFKPRVYPSEVISKREWYQLCKGTRNFSHVSVRDPAGLCQCPGPSLSTSAPRPWKQKSPEDLHKCCSFTGCQGGPGDAAEKSSWKSNYGCLPQQRSSGAVPQPLFSCTQKGEKRNSVCSKYLFTGWGG